MLRTEKAELLALLEERDRRYEGRRLSRYGPYAKQREFHKAGATFRERLFMAGNQLGKTLAGGAEVAMHLTGQYPDWWDGIRFNRPTVWIAGSESAELTRDGVQRLMLGPPSDKSRWGTGFIPADTIVDTSSRPGVPDAVATILVKHVSGGNSALLLKSYDQGRSKWQANTVDGVWFDEEPPLDVYSEGITRTNSTFGPVIVTFTPLKGMSDVVLRFLEPGELDAGAVDRSVIQMTIEDAEHYTPEQRAKIVAAYPAHEREARAKGIPIMGSGKVFPVSEESIVIEPFPIPESWPQINGMDFGWDHPFAAVNIAWDREADCIYVCKEFAARESTPVVHAAAIKPWGHWIPCAWPHDGLQHDKGSGEPLAQQYRAQGLKMLDDKATHEDGGNGVEAGIFEMLDRMQTGRWKVFSNCTGWIGEMRLYHREKGLIVKLKDDRISASRYAMMMRRYARTKPKPVQVEDYHGGENAWMA
jgi:phage terminase large subunit-like protein